MPLAPPPPSATGGPPVSAFVGVPVSAFVGVPASAFVGVPSTIVGLSASGPSRPITYKGKMYKI